MAVLVSRGSSASGFRMQGVVCLCTRTPLEVNGVGMVDRANTDVTWSSQAYTAFGMGALSVLALPSPPYFALANSCSDC